MEIRGSSRILLRLVDVEYHGLAEEEHQLPHHQEVEGHMNRLYLDSSMDPCLRSDGMVGGWPSVKMVHLAMRMHWSQPSLPDGNPRRSAPVPPSHHPGFDPTHA